MFFLLIPRSYYFSMTKVTGKIEEKLPSLGFKIDPFRAFSPFTNIFIPPQIII